MSEQNGFQERLANVKKSTAFTPVEEKEEYPNVGGPETLAEGEVPPAGGDGENFLDPNSTVGRAYAAVMEHKQSSDFLSQVGSDTTTPQVEPSVQTLESFGQGLVYDKADVSEAGSLEAKMFTTTLGKIGEVGTGVSVSKVQGSTATARAPRAVKDTEGRLSEIVTQIATSAKVRIIPASITKIPEFASLKLHNDFQTGLGRYFVPKGDSDSLVNSIIEEAEEELSQGKVFRYVVSAKGEYQGQSFHTFNLSPAEVSSILAQLSPYGAKAVDLGEGTDTLAIVAGDYIL